MNPLQRAGSGGGNAAGDVQSNLFTWNFLKLTHFPHLTEYYTTVHMPLSVGRVDGVVGGIPVLIAPERAVIYHPWTVLTNSSVTAAFVGN